MKTIRILIACGTGIATSTVIANRVKEKCEEAGLKVMVDQTSVPQVETKAPGFDLVIASCQIPASVTTPYISGISYLTGIGAEQTDEQIVEKVKELSAE